MNAEELLRRYAAGERDFRGIDLRFEETRMGLMSADLRGINLRGADLYHVSLVNVKEFLQPKVDPRPVHTHPQAATLGLLGSWSE